MPFRSSFRRSNKHRRLRQAGHEPTGRRLRFETFEDRRMLSFTPVGPFETGGSGFFDVVTADFNNDSHLDLAGVHAVDNTVSVLLGDGQGGFGEAHQIEVGEYPSSVAVGDFNEDGKVDLAVGNQLSGDLSVLLGNGDGTFEPTDPLPTDGNPRSVAVGDFNADGKLDLGVAAYGYGFLGYYGYATVLAGDGNAHFAVPKTTVAFGANFNSATAGDLDGDGADDLVISNEWNGPTAGDVHVFLGDESGYLQTSDVLYINQTPVDYITDVAVGDLNSDGVADIVAANYYNSDLIHKISVLLGDGQGGYGPEQAYGGSAYSRLILLGDFTGEGHIDIANDVANILSGNGDGTFSEFPTGLTYENAIAGGDFNGDGWLDIVGLSVWLNDGDWGQANPNPLPGDYNGNGTVDAADYTVWRDSLGRSDLLPYSGADGSGNGIVGPEDYDVWKSHFGQTLPPPGASSDATVTEVDAVVVNATATLALSKTDPLDVPVRYDKAEMSATANSDYMAKPGDAVVPAGQTARTLAVALSAANDRPRKTSYRTVHGTAKSTSRDYVSKTGTLTFAPGRTTKSVTPEVKAGKNAETDETFFLDLLDKSSKSAFAKFRGIGTTWNDVWSLFS